MSFSINTRRDLTLSPEQQAKGEGPPVLVQLGILRSYEHMGIGVARCEWKYLSHYRDPMSPSTTTLILTKSSCLHPSSTRQLYLWLQVW